MKANFKKLSIVLFIQVGFLSSNVSAQNNIFISYLDSNWAAAPQHLATTKIVKEFNGKTYLSKAYNLKENYYIGFGHYLDTTYAKPVGLHVDYYKDGTIKDSSFYNDDSKSLFEYVYNEKGKLTAEYHFDPTTKKEVSKGYDEQGNEIPDFIFEREAAFPGGSEGWIKHLIKNMNPKVPIKRKAPNGTYQVVIRFIVDKTGALTDMSAETNMGYGMEEEAMRVLKKSPNWLPAIQYNKPVNAYRRQPITFVVQ